MAMDRVLLFGHDAVIVGIELEYIEHEVVDQFEEEGVFFVVINDAGALLFVAPVDFEFTGVFFEMGSTSLQVHVFFNFDQGLAGKFREEIPDNG